MVFYRTTAAYHGRDSRHVQSAQEGNIDLGADALLGRGFREAVWMIG